MTLLQRADEPMPHTYQESSTYGVCFSCGEGLYTSYDRDIPAEIRWCHDPLNIIGWQLEQVGYRMVELVGILNGR